MSNDIAIRVEKISKLYRIGRNAQTHDSFAGMLISLIKYPLSNYRALRSLTSFKDKNITDNEHAHFNRDIIWALRDVSFEVEKGDVLGIIGNNGAGKSTLLKVLSHVTEPSAGRVEIHGRISSLLEVGTGFHPELSGRDNVYLNGTILGMTKNEIDNKFDEIVDFSGVEKFIDTPVKRYSSGMRLRLAFSVAAHLRTEIMLIDEVLAVGDAAFRKKCIERMKFLASEGRTVVLVSHNMSIVSSMCSKGIVLQRGKMHFAGSASAAVGAYERLSAQTSDSTFVNSEGGVVIKSLRLERAADKLTPESQMSFLIDVAIKKPYWTASVVFGLRTLEGEGLVLDVADSSKFPDMIIPGVYTFRVSLPKLWLRPRTYTVRSKIIAHPEVGKAERFESDPVDIVIDGSEVTGLYDWMLQPQVDWEINSLTS